MRVRKIQNAVTQNRHVTKRIKPKKVKQEGSLPVIPELREVLHQGQKEPVEHRISWVQETPKQSVKNNIDFLVRRPTWHACTLARGSHFDHRPEDPLYSLYIYMRLS